MVLGALEQMSLWGSLSRVSCPFPTLRLSSTEYCNLFCFFPYSPTAPIRNQLAKIKNISLPPGLQQASPGLLRCDATQPLLHPSGCSGFPTSHPEHPCLFLAAVSPLCGLSPVGVDRDISKTRCLER